MHTTSFPDTRRAGSTGRGAVIASVALLAGIALHATVLARPSSTRSASGQSNRDHVENVETAPQQASHEREATGPTRVEHGVPAGFARTADGAVAAAASFVCTGQTVLDMDPLAAEEAVREMAAAGTADQQARDMMTKLRAARDALSGGSGDTVYRQAAIAWRVDSFSPDRARVAIWNVGVLTREGVAPPQAGWATSVFELVWERDDWKIATETITPGPAPILDNSAAPSTATQFVSSLEGFTDFGDDR